MSAFRRFSSLLVLGLGFAAAACNTVEGAGKDIGNAGESITDAAQKTKEKINNR